MKQKARLHYPAAAMIYAHLLPCLQVEARKCGYALAVHGSMGTDFDLLACPWTEEAVNASVLAEVIRKSVNGYFIKWSDGLDHPIGKPHGRLSWSIYFSEDTEKTRQGLYIDLSVMPRIGIVEDKTQGE